MPSSSPTDTVRRRQSAAGLTAGAEVRRLAGVGPKLAERRVGLGIVSIGDVVRQRLEDLQAERDNLIDYMTS